MNWLTSIFSSGASKLVDTMFKGIDSLVSSDEEKMKLKNELQASINDFQVVMETKAAEFEKEITERWKSDNEHSVTRLVRPVSYALTLLVFGIILFLDGNLGEFTIKENYIPVIETLLSTMTVAYFGSRGIEKTMKHFKAKE